MRVSVGIRKFMMNPVISENINWHQTQSQLFCGNTGRRILCPVWRNGVTDVSSWTADSWQPLIPSAAIRNQVVKITICTCVIDVFCRFSKQVEYTIYMVVCLNLHLIIWDELKTIVNVSTSNADHGIISMYRYYYIKLYYWRLKLSLTHS